MTHLTDMEELLTSVLSSDVQDYMREAMDSYNAGVYRGCIVLSYIALFDDLLAKLAELGKVNQPAKKVYVAADKKKADQEIFESFLIDQLGSNNLVSGLDTAFLNTLRTLRNKSAHPSGHNPSPEEARFVFFEVITRFLSKPILSTTQLVDELIQRLRNKNFFPTTQISDIKVIVNEEISLLHEEAFPQLVSKLANESISKNAIKARNAGFFLTGLASLNKVNINTLIQKKLIQAQSDDSSFHILILRLVSANGKLFIGLNKTTVSRFKKIFSERVNDVTAAVSDTQFSHPVFVLHSLQRELGDDQIISNFEEELKVLFHKRPYSNFLISSLMKLPKTSSLYIGEIKKKAESSTFKIANSFASSLRDIDEYLSKLASTQEAFEIIVAVLEAADWGAFNSQGLRNTKFSQAPDLRASAIKYIKKNKRKVKKYIADKLDVDIKADDFVSDYLV